MVLTYIVYCILYLVPGCILVSLVFDSTEEIEDKIHIVLFMILLYPLLIIGVPVFIAASLIKLGWFIKRKIKALPWDTIENKLRRLK